MHNHKKLDIVHHIQLMLEQSVQNKRYHASRFFKTQPGDYAAHDQFLGVPIPVLRQYTRQFKHLSLSELQRVLNSPFNECRLLALFILNYQYQKGSADTRHIVYQFYVDNRHYINNWNLVDSSAHLIIGQHLYNNENKEILFILARSTQLWDRRIAIVATLYFIRHYHFATTLALAQILLNDTQDLIHKSVGWMLREVGKRDQTVLTQFLDQHVLYMPRTMLRYALEKLSLKDRTYYLNLKKLS